MEMQNIKLVVCQERLQNNLTEKNGHTHIVDNDFTAVVYS